MFVPAPLPFCIAEIGWTPGHRTKCNTLSPADMLRQQSNISVSLIIFTAEKFRRTELLRDLTFHPNKHVSALVLSSARAASYICPILLHPRRVHLLRDTEESVLVHLHPCDDLQYYDETILCDHFRTGLPLHYSGECTVLTCYREGDRSEQSTPSHSLFTNPNHSLYLSGTALCGAINAYERPAAEELVKLARLCVAPRRDRSAVPDFTSHCNFSTRNRVNNKDKGRIRPAAVLYREGTLLRPAGPYFENNKRATPT